MDTQVLAPISYLAVEFPTGQVTGEGFSLVHDLASRGTIAVLDLEFIAKAPDGTVSKVPLNDIEHGSDVDISQWHGSYSGLLDQDDVDAVAAVMAPGSLAGILVYENVWATPLVEAMDRNGARLLGSGGVDPDDVVDVLDRAELT